MLSSLYPIRGSFESMNLALLELRYDTLTLYGGLCKCKPQGFLLVTTHAVRWDSTGQRCCSSDEGEA